MHTLALQRALRLYQTARAELFKILSGQCAEFNLGELLSVRDKMGSFLGTAPAGRVLEGASAPLVPNHVPTPIEIDGFLLILSDWC
jgi:hypothetical protein